MNWLAREAGGAREESTTKSSGEQLEFFEEALAPLETKKSRVIPFLIFLAVIAVSFCLIGTAFAEERIMGSGLLCDEETQVHAFLSAVAQKPVGGQVPDIQGCGYLSSPTTVGYEVVGEYEDDFVKATIVRVTGSNFGVQYTYTNWVPKPPTLNI